MIAVIIIALLSVINFAEAWLEEVVILLKDPNLPNYKELNKREHWRSGVYAVILTIPFILAAIYFHLFWLIPAIITNRRLVFDNGLKYFRKRKLFRYEGDGPIDSFFRNLFGEYGAWKEICIWIIITTASIYSTIYLKL